MAATIQLKFGSLALDSTNNVTISGISEKSAKPVRAIAIPVTDGAIAEEAKLGPKIITIKGDIVGAGYETLRTNIDALHAGLMNGIQSLTKDDERYIKCQLKDFSYQYDHLTTRATWVAQFIAHFPFWLGVTLNTDTRTPSTGVAYAITNAGNAPTRLKVQVTAPGGGITDDMQIENTTKGEICSYRGTVAAAEVLIVDNRVASDDFIVSNDAVNDFENFEGDFLNLNAGANNIELTGTMGVTVVSWRNAWY